MRSETAERPSQGGGLFREAEQGAGGTESYHVSAVDDPAELRAEAAADRVMGGGIFREADHTGGGRDGIFRAAGGAGPEGGEAELSTADLAEPGSALPGGLQESMGSALGADFSGVRVHTGPGADRASGQISARAFTRGQDVYFRSGEYDPVSQGGQHLIAHELAHVANGDSGLHRAGGNGTSGQSSQPSQGGGTTPPAGGGTTPPAGAAATGEELLQTPAAITQANVSRVIAYIVNKTGDIPDKSGLQELRDRYITQNKIITGDQMTTDKTAVQSLLDGKVHQCEELLQKLINCRDGVADGEIKNKLKLCVEAYEEKLEPYRTEVTAVKDAIDETIGNQNDAVLSELAKSVLLDPNFEKFRKAAADLQTVGAAFADEDKAAHERATKNVTLGKAGAEVSLREKQAAMGITAEPDAESRAAKGFHAVGDAASEISGDIGAVAGTSTAHKKGKAVDAMPEDSEEQKEKKKEAKEKADELTGNREEGVSAIGESVGSALNSVGGIFDTHELRKQATEQKNQSAEAKSAMRSIAAQLERTIPNPQPSAATDPTDRIPKIQAVCDRLKKDESNKNRGSILPLIDAAMADKVEVAQSGNQANTSGGNTTASQTTSQDVTPALKDNQKKMLSTMRVLETSRANSKEAAASLKKDTLFSALETIGGFLSSAGSLFTGISKLLDSSVGGIVGAVLSLAGKILGQVSAARAAMAPKDDADAQREEKMAASRTIIQQMAALNPVGDAEWAMVDSAAKGTAAGASGSGVSWDVMNNIDQYAGVFISIQASNVNISDILFAIQRGGFGTTDAGGNAKTAQASLDDLYANLSFS